MSLSKGSVLTLRTLALAYLAVLVALPVGTILWRTFEPGLGQFWEWITTPAAISALQTSLIIVVITVPLNVVFGIVVALGLVRGRFPGKAIVQSIVDLPFSVSPVIVGVALIMLWGQRRLVRWGREPRLPRDLRAARHGAGHRVRDPAVHRA
jgi:sulfate transport system permease protein